MQQDDHHWIFGASQASIFPIFLFATVAYTLFYFYVQKGCQYSL